MIDSLFAQSVLSQSEQIPTSGWQFVLVTAITAVCGGGGTAALVTKWLDYKSAKRKDDQGQEKSTAVRLQARIEHLEKSHEDCTKNAIAMAMELGSLREAVRILTVRAGLQDELGKSQTPKPQAS